MPQTGQLRNIRNISLRVWEAGKSKIKGLADLGSGESQLSVSQVMPSSSNSDGRGPRELPWVFVLEGH